MNKLRLTLACSEYDYLQPLRERQVEPEGIDLTLVSVESSERHTKMLDCGEYDASEFSMGTYLVARSQGIDEFHAIPFIARRMFCHRFFFVKTGSTIKTPADLRNRRIGILSYQNSLAIFAKGILSHDYGVHPTDVTWVTVAKERVTTKPPSHVNIERATVGATLEQLLLDGEIDVAVQPDLPNAWFREDPLVARLFPNYEADERAYYEQTGVFPIMHPIVIKSEILKEHPWVAQSLYNALEKSRITYTNFMSQPHRLSLVWPRVEEEKKFFKKPPYSQGFSANRNDVQSMINLANEQGLLARSLSAEELFVTDTLGT